MDRQPLAVKYSQISRWERLNLRFKGVHRLEFWKSILICDWVRYSITWKRLHSKKGEFWEKLGPICTLYYVTRGPQIRCFQIRSFFIGPQNSKFGELTVNTYLSLTLFHDLRIFRFKLVWFLRFSVKRHSNWCIILYSASKWETSLKIMIMFVLKIDSSCSLKIMSTRSRSWGTIDFNAVSARVELVRRARCNRFLFSCIF